MCSLCCRCCEPDVPGGHDKIIECSQTVCALLNELRATLIPSESCANSHRMCPPTEDGRVGLLSCEFVRRASAFARTVALVGPLTLQLCLSKTPSVSVRYVLSTVSLLLTSELGLQKKAKKVKKSKSIATAQLPVRTQHRAPCDMRSLLLDVQHPNTAFGDAVRNAAINLANLLASLAELFGADTDEVHLSVSDVERVLLPTPAHAAASFVFAEVCGFTQLYGCRLICTYRKPRTLYVRCANLYGRVMHSPLSGSESCCERNVLH
jgi:hypothetical protein